MGKQYTKINIVIGFTNPIKEESFNVERFTDYFENEIDKHLQIELTKEDYNISVITEEKRKNDVLYEDGFFRILKTKSCNALLQERKDEKDGGFIWHDRAWFSCGADDQCFEQARKEIDRLSSKNKKYKPKCTIEQKEKIKKQKTITLMSDEQKSTFLELLDTLKNNENEETN